MYKKNYLLGIILIVIGALLLCRPMLHIDFFDMEHFWPIFVLLPGLLFEVGGFSSKSARGTLVPGGILTTIGILFFFETYTNWQFSEYTWPVYVLAPAIGLFQLYLFERRTSLLIPVGILTTVAVVSFINMFCQNVFSYINSTYIWAAILILIGIVILIKGLNNKD